jgi:formate dehydrogenase subunit delta
VATATGTDTLVRMINQIAANVRHHPVDEAATQIATHINAFWAPSMRADLLAYAAAGGAGLDDLAVHALPQIR